MISQSALIQDLKTVLENHLRQDPRLELALTLHVRPSAEEVPYSGEYVPDIACFRITVDNKTRNPQA